MWDTVYTTGSSGHYLSGGSGVYWTPTSSLSIDTGSLMKTGSVSLNTLTFTKGDNSSFSLAINTGSFLVTSSVSLNTLTFEKGDGSTFNLVVDTGSGGGSTLRKDTWRLFGSDMISALFVRDNLDYMLMPYSGSFDDVLVYAFTAPTGSGITIDLTLNGNSIFSTKPTIDDGENSSNTAAIPYVLSTSSFSPGDLLALNIDGVGTTGSGKGLNIQIETTQTS